MSLESLQDRLREHHGTLSETDRRLAQSLLEQGPQLAACSATELAQQAGVSKASAARFFRRLGYRDFASFRLEMRQGLSQSSPLHQLPARGSRTQTGATGAHPLAEHVQGEVRRLEALAQAVSDERATQAVALLAGARRVAVVGYRNGLAPATYAHGLLSQLRPHVDLASDGAGREADFMADLGPKDLSLVIDFRRRTRRLSALLGACAQARVPVLLITDDPIGAPAAQAACVLPCPRVDEQLFDSYLGAMSLLNHLATQMALRQPRAARARLAQIEVLHQQLDDLEPDSLHPTVTA